MKKTQQKKDVNRLVVAAHNIAKNLTTVFMTAVFLLAFLANAMATDWYVRPGGTGSYTGADWNNALDLNAPHGIPWGSVSGGDTIWLAGGTYTNNLYVHKSGSAGNYINIKRVLSTDTTPAGASGWSSSFDSQVIVSPTNNVPCFWNDGSLGSYVCIDGRVDQGISFRLPNITSGAGITLPGAVFFSTSVTGVHNVVLTNLDIAGPATANAVTFYGNVPMCALAFTGGASYGGQIVVSNVTVSHCQIHGAFDLVCLIGVTNSVFDHCRFYDCPFDTGPYGAHNNVVQWASSGNVTFCYNVFNNWYSEGIMLGSQTDSTDYGPAYIYGNIFKPNAGTNSARAVEARWNTQTMYFYNNDCIDFTNNATVFNQASGDGVFSSSSACSNNIYWHSTVSAPPAHIDYEFTDAASSSIPNTPAYPAVDHCVYSGSNPFVNPSAGDYHIISTVSSTLPRDKGTALTSPSGKTYGLDMDGDIRGLYDGWDIGAYEYAYPFSNLVNIQFRVDGSAVKSGMETYGFTSSDVWSQVVGSSGGTEGGGNFTVYCVDSSGAASPIVVSASGLTDSFTMSDTDALYQSCLGSGSGSEVTISVTMPTGSYSIAVDGIWSPGIGPTQYSVFSGGVGLTVTGSGPLLTFGSDGSTPLVITVDPGTEITVINGLQIWKN